MNSVRGNGWKGKALSAYSRVYIWSGVSPVTLGSPVTKTAATKASAHPPSS